MQRQSLALELGPEGYREFIDSRMDDAMKVIGPAAANLYPYFMQDFQNFQPETDPLAGLLPQDEMAP
jgi:hypothetical protein